MARFILFQFQGSPLSTEIDGREFAGTIRSRCTPVSVVMIWCGLLSYVSRESGNGLLSLEKSDLDRRSGASPFDHVMAGIERLAVGDDFILQVKCPLIGIPCKC